MSYFWIVKYKHKRSHLIQNILQGYYGKWVWEQGDKIIACNVRSSSEWWQASKLVNEKEQQYLIDWLLKIDLLGHITDVPWPCLY